MTVKFSRVAVTVKHKPVVLRRVFRNHSEAAHLCDRLNSWIPDARFLAIAET